MDSLYGRAREYLRKRSIANVKNTKRTMELGPTNCVGRRVGSVQTG